MTTAICIASGPSLTQEDVDYCRGKGRVYVINTSFRRAPWADILYACDGPWWNKYIDEVRRDFRGELWTIDTAAADKYSLRMAEVDNHSPFSKKPNVISLGSNSGFQTLNLAYVQGAKKIILLGYDMKLGPAGEKHWHGDHPADLLQTNPYEYQNWIRLFKAAAPLIDVPVINCSRVSALECFERMPLESAL